MDLRDYQTVLKNDIYRAWDEGAQNVCAQLATGGGKTAIFSRVIKEVNAPTVVCAHRMQIVCQISLALAREKIAHNLVGPPALIKTAVAMHIKKFGMSFFNRNASTHVASVDTLIKRPRERWHDSIGLIVQDEAHHVLKNNKWGAAAAMFKNAKGLYPTATPLRADGKGLGRHASGVIDVLVQGPPMRALIADGYLSDYRIFAPLSDLDLTNVPITQGGDFSPAKLRQAVRESHITGDIVDHYLKFAPGKLGVTFAVDIQSAKDIAVAYRSKGVPAEVISGKTPDSIRFEMMRRFENREILQLVNVDLLDEGVDVPAIEVVTMARATQSYAKYSQSVGRGLRSMAGKDKAIIIDPVGNTLRHNVPDAARIWSLDDTDRKKKRLPTDEIPLKTCLNNKCLSVYERHYKKCPFCAYENPVAGRTYPSQVDGDLTELSPDFIDNLRKQIESVAEGPRTYPGMDIRVQMSLNKKHKARALNQIVLKQLITIYAGYYRSDGYDDSMIYRRFFLEFQIDMLTSLTLKSAEMLLLSDKIKKYLIEKNVRVDL